MEQKKKKKSFTFVCWPIGQHEVGDLANNESYSVVISTFMGVFIAVSNQLVYYNNG